MVLVHLEAPLINNIIIAFKNYERQDENLYLKYIFKYFIEKQQLCLQNKNHEISFSDFTRNKCKNNFRPVTIQGCRNMAVQDSQHGMRRSLRRYKCLFLS